MPARLHVQEPCVLVHHTRVHCIPPEALVEEGTHSGPVGLPRIPPHALEQNRAFGLRGAGARVSAGAAPKVPVAETDEPAPLVGTQMKEEQHQHVSTQDDNPQVVEVIHVCQAEPVQPLLLVRASVVQWDKHERKKRAHGAKLEAQNAEANHRRSIHVLLVDIAVTPPGLERPAHEQTQPALAVFAWQPWREEPCGPSLPERKAEEEELDHQEASAGKKGEAHDLHAVLLGGALVKTLCDSADCSVVV
mmetsp:Transcript_81995/g.265648  ORF Transcript_81995/g.265648 Transcript_81995/m.265648 type:complete len:248 (+) Transcript_81995:1671-2414(+)